MQYSIVVMSCDKYECCWHPFFKCLDKYFPNHPKTYLVSESKECKYSQTIKTKGSWTKRLRDALEQTEEDYILLMLEDFFIRKPVDEERINKIQFTDDIICYNFEKQYRTPAYSTKEWDIQANNQWWLNSCQPTMWNKKLLIERLQCELNPQQWEELFINSPYIHFINNQDYIIDIGYRHQPLNEGWGVTRGKITKECIKFLESEGINDFNYNTLL